MPSQKVIGMPFPAYSDLQPSHQAAGSSTRSGLRLKLKLGGRGCTAFLYGIKLRVALGNRRVHGYSWHKARFGDTEMDCVCAGLDSLYGEQERGKIDGGQSGSVKAELLL